MKALLIITLFALYSNGALCEEVLAGLAKVYQDCIGEAKVDKTEVDIFLKGSIKEKTATKDMKCYIKCTMEKLNHLKDGVLDVDASLKFWSTVPGFEPHLVKTAEAYKVCKSVKGTDDCDTAYKISVCLEENGLNDDLLTGQ